jgi:hypothetical protein
LSHKKRKDSRRFSKGDIAIVLIIAIFVATIAYAFSSTNPSTATSTTSIPTLPVSTYRAQMRASDFNITNDNGCVYTEQSGRIVAGYYITIRNRFNSNFHLINASLVASVLLKNGSKINIPEKSVPVSLSFSNALSFPINLGVAGTGFENGRATLVSLIITVFVQEVNEPIIAPLVIPIPSQMANC